jgi:hypothetical protein
MYNRLLAEVWERKKGKGNETFPFDPSGFPLSRVRYLTLARGLIKSTERIN